MVVAWAGKGLPLALTLFYPSYVMNHNISTILWMPFLDCFCIWNNTSLSLYPEEKKPKNERPFQKESTNGFDFRGKSFFGIELFVALRCSLTISPQTKNCEPPARPLGVDHGNRSEL